jgi:hypothetical protein
LFRLQDFCSEIRFSDLNGGWLALVGVHILDCVSTSSYLTQRPCHRIQYSRNMLVESVLQNS